MFASRVGSEHPDGVVRIVPETEEIVAVCLQGDFDLKNARALDDQIDLALHTGNNLIVDLSEATFIDSTVLQVLVRASRDAAARQRTLILQIGTAAVVERLLEITRIERVLTRAHDRQEAVRMIEQQDGN